MTSPVDFLFGFAKTQLAYVAVRLGIPDRLGDEERSAEDLAAETGTHPASLARLLRALACQGLVRETAPGRYALTLGGRLLRTDFDGSLAPTMLLFGGPEMQRAWGELEYSVRTGKPGFDKVYGSPAFPYLADHPAYAEVFHAAMARHTRDVAPEIAAAYDFSRFGTLVDVGGGDGALLAEILRTVPALKGVLYDLPAGLAAARTTFADAGVAERCELVEGDFFDGVPGGADCYLVKSVIHDWDDERSVRILGHCREAGGTVLVVEPVLPSGPVSDKDAPITFSDVNMLVNTGGRERTEEEFRALFTTAGLNLVAVHPAGLYRLLEGHPT